MMREFVLLLFLCAGSICAQEERFDEESYEEVPSTHMPQLLSSPLRIEATIGETVTFPCDVDDLGVFVQLWKTETNRMLFAGPMRIDQEERFNIRNSSLVISPVHAKDSGEYICYISTNPPLLLAHKLDVLYPPAVKPHPRDGLITVKEGETVTLTCSATGNPKPTMTWKHAGRRYDNFDGYSYNISSAQKRDSGEYECIADNDVGDAASAVITVEVVSAPKVYPEPKSGLVVVKEGEPVKISCEASGDPTPVILWKRPGGDKAMRLRDENKIVISETNRSHAGSYECIANNSLGISTSAIIRVQVLYAPEIKVPHPWIHAGEGTNVNISCIIRGEPAPSVMWKKFDGQVIHGGGRYHLKTNGHMHVLEIHHLKEEDFGRYTCVASNSLSSSQDNVHIIGTPQVPVFTSKPHGSQSSKYTISWRVDSHTPVDEYSLMYRKKSSTGDWTSKTIPASETREGSTHNQMFQLLSLEPSTSYEAVVTARNKFGWSKQSEAIVFTTKSAALVDYPDLTPTTEETKVVIENVTQNALVNNRPAVLLTSATPTEEMKAVLENDPQNQNEKHSEKMASGAPTNALSLLSLFTLVLVTVHRSLL